jgi:multidrug resistance protein, MATE family
MTCLAMRPHLQTEIREFFKLTIPLASAQVAQAATGFIDTIMMGWLGQETLAGGGLAAITFMAFLLTGTGILAGVSPLVAEAFGAKQSHRVGQVTRQGLWIALLLTLPGMQVIGHLDTMMTQAGQAPQTVALANTYLDIMLWGLFPALGFAVLRSVVTSLSQARPVMAIVIGATLFNAVGNYVLAFGKFGFPAMGIAGLALASIFAHWIMFLSLLIYMLWHKSLQAYGLFHKLQRLELPILGKLLKIGLPVGVSAALENGLVMIVMYLAGTLGTHVLAAHQIVLQTIIVIFMVPVAMSYAATIRVGQWLGQQNWRQARQAGYVSMGVGAVFMTVMAIALLTHPRQVIGLYLDLNNPANNNVLAVAVPMLIVAALGQILDGVQRTANGALQGLQDTRVPMLLGFFSFWGVGLTSGYLLGIHFNLGGAGLWLGQSIGLAVAAGVFIWRFSRKVPKLKLNAIA